MADLSLPPSPTGVVTLRIAARAPDLDTFVRRFGPHIHGDRFFIATRSPRPVGTTVRFMLEIQDGQPILQGEGKVVRVSAEGTPGMEVLFVPLDDRSRTVLSIMERDRAARATTARPSAPPPLPASVRRPPPPPVPKRKQVAAAPAEPTAPLPVEPAAPSAAPSVETAPPPVVVAPALSPPEAAGAPTSPAPSSTPNDNADEDVTTVDPSGLVPANPFFAITDGDIEYFVDWSVDQASAENDTVDREPGLYADQLPSVPAAKARGWVPLVYLLVGGVAGGALVHFLGPSRSAPNQVAIAPAPPSPAPATPAPSVAAPAPPVEAPAPPVEAPAPSPPTAKPSADALVKLEIVTEPRGASVTVDGRAVGRAPVHIEVSAGPHEVRASRSRYAELVQTVEAPGQVALKLQRPSAGLDVESSPAGAEVKIRGKASGKTPLHVELAAFKNYEIEVALDHKVWKRKVYVKPHMSTLVATLDRKK